MRNIWRWLRRQLDKLPSGAHLSLDANHARGRWRVLYPNGYRTRPLHYDVAKDYAHLYGGRVIHVQEYIEAKVDAAIVRVQCGLSTAADAELLRETLERSA